ncbi:hypothetical protein [Nocardia brasiliensis]|uniref:hypothetical protein n=1 Tax=Nocardia brasiliensis TaxID=37326 RepID=UPI0024551ECB|nr:hypothetical protein [Nocardia brasiliensis]
MRLHELADAAIITMSLVFVVTLVGIGLGKVSTLVDQVHMLEGWISDVRYELLAQEQADELALLRERLRTIETKLGTDHGVADDDAAVA